LLITQGIASGDVTEHSAIIWSRVNKEAQMNVGYDADINFFHAKSKTGNLVEFVTKGQWPVED